ncbi:PREDICTED: uncharacterized protein LOC106809290 [Priapulus caudatus]|uniref:Uncharacterized protein LOC106809290 n=1 Tax=Priapulus caudatus TaxID=37621 RepID=A0ABM1E6I7_PRICU|nr:PREDICTED: uncharacterized protein LOC106809290 [Priapulus caudatus]
MKCPVDANVSADMAHFPHPHNSRSDDFSDFMWMEDMENFDRQVIDELWEQEFMEHCLDEMLQEEERGWQPPPPPPPPNTVANYMGFEQQMNRLNVADDAPPTSAPWRANGAAPLCGSGPPPVSGGPAARSGEWSSRSGGESCEQNGQPACGGDAPINVTQPVGGARSTRTEAPSMSLNNTGLNPFAKEFVPRWETSDR